MTSRVPSLCVHVPICSVLECWISATYNNILTTSAITYFCDKHACKYIRMYLALRRGREKGGRRAGYTDRQREREIKRNREPDRQRDKQTETKKEVEQKGGTGRNRCRGRGRQTEMD